MSILTSVIKKIKSYTYYKLTFVTILKNIEEDSFREDLKSLYEDRDIVVKRMATIINSFYTQGLTSAFISRPIITNLLKKDKNTDVNSCNGDVYAQLLHRMIKSGIIEVIKPAESHKAGLYKITDKDLCNFIYIKVGRDVCKTQEETAIRVWEEEEKTIVENGRLANIPTNQVKDWLLSNAVRDDDR